MKNEKVDNLLRVYAEKRSEIAKLQAQCDTIKDQLIDFVEPWGTLRKDFGTFQVRTARKWKYSSEVRNFENTLRGMKKTEREEGEAVSEETKSLIFTPVVKEGGER